ncbi:MAG TPA: hypothetical protein VEC37_02855 [Bacillota bacterium]|nr:hypothetical protein [Bacillota bacterium]
MTISNYGKGGTKFWIVMDSATFRMGFSDYRNKLGFRKEYNSFKNKEMAYYEYGRLLAALYPEIKAIPPRRIKGSVAYKLFMKSLQSEDNDFTQKRKLAKKLMCEANQQV